MSYGSPALGYGAAALACASLAIAAVPSADATSYTFGVLRRDGIVVPFARLDDGHWRRTWTPPQPDPEVPTDVRSVPRSWWGPSGPAEEWFATLRTGPPVTLHIVQPDVIPAYCVRQVGLRTDYTSEPRPPLGEHPYPKDGLAVTPRLDDVQPIELLDAESAEAAALVPVVATAFNAMERNIFRHPVSVKDREAVAPRIEALYAFGDRPRYYYVEAVRAYRKHGGSERCTAEAAGHVWVARDGGDPKPLSTSVLVQDCDGGEAVYMNPLGIVRSGGRLFWIAQFAGWQDESYQVIELKPAAVDAVLIASGGSC